VGGVAIVGPGTSIVASADGYVFGLSPHAVAAAGDWETTLWIGPWSERKASLWHSSEALVLDGDDAGIAFSLQNITVAPLGTVVLRVPVHAGVHFDPLLSVEAPTTPAFLVGVTNIILSRGT
jgi:hypothetical protein